MPMRAAFGSLNDGTLRALNDTQEYILMAAYFSKLDKLSFKGRIITLLLETDQERARNMVFQIGGQLGLKARTCEDVFTYMPDDIYPIVGKVAKAVFTDKQIAEGQRALFIAPWIENIESPRQIYPALNFIYEFQGSPVERQLLFNAMSRAMDRNFKDDRSFTYTWEGIAGRVGKVAGGEADPLKGELVNAFRSMAQKNLRSARCKDNEIKKEDSLPEYLVAINKLFPDKPLSIEDLSSTEYSGVPKVRHILQFSSIAKKQKEELMTIRDQKIVDNKVVNHDVNDIEWAARVTEFVDRGLAMEGSDGETEGEMLFLRAALAGAMLSGIDAGELQNSILRKYLRLLLSSKLQKTSFIEWRRWLADAERMAPQAFSQIASEFPNQNLKVIVAANMLLAEPKKVETKTSTSTTPKP
ncbi:MAG: hypothetical protein QM785_16540 [Pyrinomonadaceae bacterium]